MIQVGDKLKALYSEEPVSVVSQLNDGGTQGSVFVANVNGKKQALKWYKSAFATESQKKIISTLISQIRSNTVLKNNECFVWPTDMVIGDNQQFGYLMELIDTKEYFSVGKLIAGQLEGVDFIQLMQIGYNLSGAFAKLHTSGLVYVDINFNNIYINPKTGDVKIIDNDNVVVIGEPTGVDGTSGFRAPELITGQSPTPDAETDRFSLAVILFHILFREHPLNGAQEAKIAILDEAAQTKIYGKNPIFMFDPADGSNRPVPGEHDNAILFWKIYPTLLKDTFVKAFTAGLKNKDQRVKESEWQRVFLELKNTLSRCYNCGASNFYDVSRIKLGIDTSCWNCKNKMKVPPRIKIKASILVLDLGVNIHQFQISNSRQVDFNAKVAEVVQNPKKPQIWGLKNLSNNTWNFINANGESKEISTGNSVVIRDSTEIHFGNGTIGKIRW